jgi:hypothetical protein
MFRIVIKAIADHFEDIVANVGGIFSRKIKN